VGVLQKAAIRALLACLALAFLAAAPCILAQAGHDCTCKGHCPVCLEMQWVLDLLRHLDTAVVRGGLWAGIPGLAAVSGGVLSARAAPASSVSLKVRLNT
jgi:hypothetical protein